MFMFTPARKVLTHMQIDSLECLSRVDWNTLSTLTSPNTSSYHYDSHPHDHVADKNNLQKESVP